MSNETMEIKNLPSGSRPCNSQSFRFGGMLCIGIDDALHVDETIEDLGVASIFEVTILPSPSYIIFINRGSQLQEI